MGTAVLSPRDCFASPHHQLSEMIYQSSSAPRLGRNALDVSRTSDGARRNSSSATVTAGERDSLLNHRNSSAGLLPVPSNRLHSHPSSLVRSSSNSYFKQTMSPASPTSRQTTTAGLISPLHVPPSAMSAVPISFSSVKLKTSRSASAGLPNRGAQASAGSGLGRERPKLSSSRLPFKVVQVDGAVNGRAHEIRAAPITLQQSEMQSSKFSSVKSGFEKKRVGSERVGDLKKRAHSDTASRQENDGVLLSPKVSLQSDGGTTGQRKDVEGKEVGKIKSQRGNSTAVTILQRPKNKEAADELIAKFFTNVDRLSSANEVLGSETQVKKGKSEHQTYFMEVNVSSSLKEQDFPKKIGRSKDVSSDTPCQAKAHNRSPDPSRFALDENFAVGKKDESSHGSEALKALTEVSVSPPSGQPCSKVKESSISYSDMEVDEGCGGFPRHPFPVIGNEGWVSMVGNERWAGSAYTNSPPPSALPLPKFSMKQSRTLSLELSSVTDQLVESTSNQSLAGITLGSSGSLSPVHGQKGVWDVTFATKDLRRMLNLDSH